MAAVMSPPASNTTSTSSLSSHASPPHSTLTQLPPIATATANKRTKSSSVKRQSTSSNSAPASSKRASQHTRDRMSSISTASRTSRTNSTSNLRGETSRTHSTVFPLFHSSLPYSLVRDFGYPITDPLHYGPLPESSGLATPSSELNRRLSDPAPAYGDARSTSAFGDWTIPDDFSQLPSRSFADDGESSGEWPRFADHGPPYSEDEDLQSPVISTHGSHRRQQSNVVGMDRTRGRAGSRGMMSGSQAFQQAPSQRRRKKKSGRRREAEDAAKGTLPSRSFHEGETYTSSDEDTDNDEEDSTPNAAGSPHNNGDNIATSLQNTHLSAPYADNDDEEEHRHSMTYTFSIASPDEECHGKAVSLYNFERENDNELPLVEGQIILVSYRLSQGWLVAQDPRTGESGLVPESYVRLFRDLEGWEPDDEEDDEDRDAGAGRHGDDGNNNDNNNDTAGGSAEAQASQIPADGVLLPPDALQQPPPSGGGEAKPQQQQQQDWQVTASPEPTDPLPRDSPEASSSLSSSPAKPAAGATASATPHKPAVSSTFSTSRDDLEPRVDLLKHEEQRRGSLDKPARTASKGKGVK